MRERKEGEEKKGEKKRRGRGEREKRKEREKEEGERKKKEKREKREKRERRESRTGRRNTRCVRGGLIRESIRVSVRILNSGFETPADIVETTEIGFAVFVVSCMFQLLLGQKARVSQNIRATTKEEVKAASAHRFVSRTSVVFRVM